jgi:hypothetical protein
MENDGKAADQDIIDILRGKSPHDVQKSPE